MQEQGITGVWRWNQRSRLKGRQEGTEEAGSVQRSGNRSLIRECDISSVRHLSAWGSEMQVGLTPAHLREQGDGLG